MFTTNHLASLPSWLPKVNKKKKIKQKKDLSVLPFGNNSSKLDKLWRIKLFSTTGPNVCPLVWGLNSARSNDAQCFFPAVIKTSWLYCLLLFFFSILAFLKYFEGHLIFCNTPRSHSCVWNKLLHSFTFRYTCLCWKQQVGTLLFLQYQCSVLWSRGREIQPHFRFWWNLLKNDRKRWRLRAQEEVRSSATAAHSSLLSPPDHLEDRQTWRNVSTC